MPRKSVLATAFLCLCFAAAASADGANLRKINGSIHVDAGQRAGNLGTVNGSVQIDEGASVGTVSTVNGGIELAANANAESLRTVNGGIRLDAGAHVANGIGAVNGSISAGKGVDVSGRVSNVSGRITLAAAHVGGGVETVAGDIDVGADSKIEGGILVRQPHGSSRDTSRTPRIVIGPRAVVEGALEFHREVQLRVSDRARIGSVSGATAQTFSGDQP